MRKTTFEKEIEERLNKKFSFSKFLALFSVLSVIIVFVDFLMINQKLIDGELISYDFSVFTVAIPSSCTLCAATIAFYFNKTKFENCMKIRFSYIQQLILFKKKSGLYTKQELEMQLNDSIAEVENETNGTLQNTTSTSEQEVNI